MGLEATLISTVAQLGGTGLCLLFGIRWLNNQREKDNTKRDLEREERFKDLKGSIDESKQEAKECREAREEQTAKFHDMMGEKDKVFTSTLETIVGKNLDHIGKLESRVYEALTTGRAMVVQLEDTVKAAKEGRLSDIAPEDH